MYARRANVKVDSENPRIPQLKLLAGKDVDVIVMEQDAGRKAVNMPVRPPEGSVTSYDRPFEPVADSGWESNASA
jgi:hypothetical protein